MEFKVCICGEISDFIFEARHAYTLTSLIDVRQKSLFNLMSYGQRKLPAATAQLRANFPSRRVVGAAAPRLPRILRVHGLFHLGGASSVIQWKMRLLVWRELDWRGGRKLSFSIFFIRNFWEFSPRDFCVDA